MACRVGELGLYINSRVIPMPLNPRLLRPLGFLGFDPKTIAGLQGWWDASDLTTMAQNSNGTTAVTATNDPVGYWADKSGNGRHAKQSSNNNRPQVQLGDRNGRAGLNFDGSDDYFICDSGASHRARFAYAVFRRTGTPAANGAIYMTRSSASNLTSNSAQQFNMAELNGLDATKLYGLNNTPGLARLNGQTVTMTNSNFFNVFWATLAPNTTDANLVGFQGNNTDDSGTQYPCIGVDPNSASRVYIMRLYELLIYDTVPDAATYTVVERYLARKWGITLA